MKRRHESLVKKVPIDRIRVVNPRARGKAKFKQIESSIVALGLKKPIIVARRDGKDGQPAYDLVCGQGRLEAFTNAGEQEVPAIVIDASKEDLLLMSLAENLARRSFTTIDVAREIVAIKERGHTNAQIAKKIGVNVTYVSGIIRLFKQGEERLIHAVEHNMIPMSVAIDISNSDDAGEQEALLHAYEAGELRGKTLTRARQILEKRRLHGKSLHSRARTRASRRAANAAKIVEAYREEASRQKQLVQKDKLCQSRLLFAVSALKQLTADQTFVNLLRAEGLNTLPKYLADQVQSGEEVA